MNLPLNIDWQQILLHLFNFEILFAILYLLLYKPIKDFMEQRTAYYKSMDEKSQKALADAEQKKQEYNDRLQNAQAQIDEQKKQIVNQANETAKQKIEKANTEAEQIIKKARTIAEAEKSKILDSANKEISSMVMSAAKKLVFSSDSDAFDEFLDSAERSGKDE